jgi:hypothetical protein
MPKINFYPTLEEVEKADIIQLSTWIRFLRSPGDNHITESRDQFYQILEKEVKVLDRIMCRQKELGGWTSEISKKIGWE